MTDNLDQMVGEPNTAPVDNSAPDPVNNTAAPAFCPPVYVPLPAKERIPMTTRDFIFAIITLLFSIIAVDFSVFGTFNLGFAISYVAIAVIMLFYIKQKSIKFKPFSIYCGICALLCVAVFPINCDEVSKFMLFIAIVGLSAICLAGLTDIQKYSDKSYRLIFDILRICIIIPLSYMGDMLVGFFSSGEGNSKGKKSSIMIGIACALPVLFVVIPLLISSDAAFEGIMNTMFSDLSRLMRSIVLGIIVFVMLFSLLFAIVKGLVDNNSGFSYRDHMRISVITINTFLGIISSVYVIYLFSQLAYFFNAFSSILPEKYTLAEYTRRGFFEMSVICGINLVLVFVSLVFSKKENNKISLSTRLISLFISLFSLVLIATVASKMIMYISAFGMTRLRILVSVFLAVLCFIFLFTIIKLFAPKFSYMRYIVIAVTVIGISVAFADIDRVIAKYNTEMYLNGSLEEIDVWALSGLSDSAVPYLVELLDDKDKNVANLAKNELISRIDNYYYEEIDYTSSMYNNKVYTEKPTGFKSYNYTQSIAKQLIYENVIKTTN